MIMLTANDLYYLKKSIKEKYGCAVEFNLSSGKFNHIDARTEKEGVMFYIDLDQDILYRWSEIYGTWIVIGNSKRINS